MTWDGIIRRKHRKAFERFLQHDNTRIRALAEEMQEEDRATRRQMRARTEFDEAAAGTSQPTDTEHFEEAETESGGESWPRDMPF